MKKYSLFLLSVLIVNTLGCKNQEKNEKKEIAAIVDSEIVYINDIDQRLTQELFDELNRIYTMRSIALNDLIKEKIIHIEATKQQLTSEIFLERYISEKLKEKDLETYAIEKDLTNNILQLKNRLITHDINSAEGKKIALKKYRETIINLLVDSLKEQSDIRFFLSPPVLSQINVNYNIVHYIGNLDSKVTLLMISDFNCDMCKQSHTLIKTLFEKYKDKVRFGFTHFASYVSPSAIATEAAAKQGKFWEMYSNIYATKENPDSTILFNIASHIGLNMKSFSKDFNDENIIKSIDENLYKIADSGIYGTPTIVINNTLIHNSMSIEEVEGVLNKKLSVGY